MRNTKPNIIAFPQKIKPGRARHNFNAERLSVIENTETARRGEIGRAVLAIERELLATPKYMRLLINEHLAPLNLWLPPGSAELGFAPVARPDAA